MKKYFAKTTKITPIKLMIVLFSIGIVNDSLVNTFNKPLLTKQIDEVVGEDKFIKLDLIITIVIIFSIFFICDYLYSMILSQKKNTKKLQINPYFCLFIVIMIVRKFFFLLS